MASQNYEEVNVYPLDDDILEQLLGEQRELTFMWGTKDHWAVGVFMSYVWRDGSFWVTSTTQRARMRAIERDPRVSVAVTSVGTSLGPSKTATAKGRVVIHDDDSTKEWFYPELAKRAVPGVKVAQRAFAKLLNSERRVVIEVVPEKWMTFDASKMMADTAVAMTQVAMPRSVLDTAESLGIDPGVATRRIVRFMGIDKPRGLLGPRERVANVLRRLWPD